MMRSPRRPSFRVSVGLLDWRLSSRSEPASSNHADSNMLRFFRTVFGDAQRSDSPSSKIRGTGASAPSDTKAVRRRLEESGIHDATGEVIDFIILNHRRNGRDVWREPEFIALSEAWGRGSPKDTWFEVIKPCNCVLNCLADMRRASEAGITQFKFRFGGMAAGHCSYSRRMDSQVVAVADAPALPSSECEHPDQCGCRWQSWLPLLSEIE